MFSISYLDYQQVIVTLSPYGEDEYDNLCNQRISIAGIT